MDRGFTPLCPLLVTFSRKGRTGIRRAALGQPNGLEQVVAHLWFIFLTFKMSQMTCKPLSYRQEDMRFAARAVAQSTLFPFPRAIYTNRAQAQGAHPSEVLLKPYIGHYHALPPEVWQYSTESPSLLVFLALGTCQTSRSGIQEHSRQGMNAASVSYIRAILQGSVLLQKRKGAGDRPVC